MANVKNFGLIGVGSDLQLGKAGTRIINTSNAFHLHLADGTSYAPVNAAGITSSAGNVTLTTGNLVLSGEAATVGIAGSTLSKQGTDVLKFDGVKAFMAPVGDTAECPTGATGMIRVNDDVPAASYMEFYNGTAWTAVATGGATGTLQTEIDNIEATLGTMVNANGTTNVAAALTNTLFGGATDLTTALVNLASGVAGKDTLDEIEPGEGAGKVLYLDGGNLWQQALPGATSGVQGYDAGLAALAAKTTTGILVQTGADTYVSRSLVAPAAGFTITDADGVAGAPTFVLANDLAAIQGLTSTGFAVRLNDGTETWATRSITGTATRITVANGDGIASSPTIDLATIADTTVGSAFVKITRDSYGRVEGTQAVVAGDITALVDATYVNVSGDSMALNASLTFSGTGTVTGLPAPVADSDAANKAYVDAVAQGLHVHAATQVVQAANIGTYANGTAGVGATLTVPSTTVIDGFTLILNATESLASRIMVIGQTNTFENGIYWATSATVWTRATDFDTTAEVGGGDFVFNQEGTLYANTGWVETETTTAIGTSPILFQQFSGAGSYSAGTGLSLTGTVFSVNLGAGIGEFATNNVGIDLYSTTASALILTTDGSTRSTSNAGKLELLLAAAGGLTQDATGLYVPASGITNAMIVNDFVTIDADTGPAETLSLGGTFNFVGDATQGISSVVSAGQVQYTIQDATTAVKGVSSFNSASFSVTAGAVSLNVVDVAHGGTGATSFTATQLLVGDGVNPIASYADLTFVDATNTLTLGGANGATFAAAGTDLVITSTATNSDIVLVPNGTGSVVVGPVGAGLIQSDTGTALTVRGNTTLTLESGTGDVIMTLASGTGQKVTVSGPTAADYATGLAAEDLVNKQYVDTAIASGASAGAIKSFQATVPLNADGTTNIGTAMPAGATVLSVKVNVTVLDSGATLSVGKSGSVAAYMTTGENDAQATGLYMAECFVTEAGAVQLIGTVASSSAAGSGTCKVIVTYQVAQ